MAQIREFIKGNVDENQILEQLFDSEGFKALSDYPNFLKTALDAMPMLDVIPGIKDLRTSEVDDASVRREVNGRGGEGY